MNVGEKIAKESKDKVCLAQLILCHPLWSLISANEVGANLTLVNEHLVED